MGNAISTSYGASTNNEANRGKSANNSTNNVTTQQSVNVRRLQNVRLIWLDKTIDEKNNRDCQKNILELRRIITCINTFTDDDQCVTFLSELENDKTCVIISGSFRQQTVPRVHDLSHVDSIFIFCGNKAWHEDWAKSWPKIRGVYTNILSICEALKEAAKQCEQDATPMSFISTSVNNNTTNQNLDRLDPSFMYTQVAKEILLTIKFKRNHFNEFIDFCCENYDVENNPLPEIKEFQQKYRAETSIWWYTYDCFLYPLTNRILREMDMNVIIKMGFFLVDLHRHIEKLHKAQFHRAHSRQPFLVYRGQALSNVDFLKMQETKGGLVSFNNFLSTSKNRNVANGFAHRAVTNRDLVGILFIMRIDPSVSSAPFAYVKDVGYYKDKEEEVLFSMNTVFRIGDIKSINENSRLFQVELTLISDNDSDLRMLTDWIREKTLMQETGWWRLSLLLVQMGDFNHAADVFITILKEATDISEKQKVWQLIGLVKPSNEERQEQLENYEKTHKVLQLPYHRNYSYLDGSNNIKGLMLSNMGEYSKALSHYKKDLAILKKLSPSNHPDLTLTYMNIGSMYYKMENYPRSLSYYEKALAIQQQSLPSNHPDLSASYNNVGFLYYTMADYPKALSYYEKAFAIQQQLLPSNHPDLAKPYNIIGLMYYNICDYSKSLSHYEKALAIQQQSLPPNHPDIGRSYSNIGMVYYKVVDYPKALLFHEKALEIRQELLPSKSSDLAASYNNIGWVYYKMGDYPKALSSHGKALTIRQHLSSPNLLDLADSCNNIGLVYYKMADYPKALFYNEKSLTIRQQLLASEHPDLSRSYSISGLLHKSMGNYARALSYYRKALEIQEESLYPNCSILSSSYDTLGWICGKLANYSEAFSYYEKALQLKHQSLPSDDPNVGISYNNIGWVYCKMGKYTKALEYCEKALRIQESLPPNNSSLGNSYDTIGEVYCKMGEYSKALPYCERAVEIQEQSHSSVHPNLCHFYSNLGDIYQKMGNYPKALSYYGRAADIAKNSLPSNHPDVQVYRMNLDRAKKTLHYVVTLFLKKN